METKKLGQSNVDVSTLGLGCWALGGGPGWGDQDEALSIATIHAALDHGINFFDSAEAYGGGDSERVLGKALVDRRDRAVIGTKVSPGNASAALLRQHLEASLQRLQTDYIDVYMVHWPVHTHPIAETLAVLSDLQAEGKIRAIGVSNFGREQLAEALEVSMRLDVNQLCYNLLSRAIEFEILPLCQKNRIGVTTYMPLMQGLLTGKYKMPGEVPDWRARTRHFSGDRPGSRHYEPGAEQETWAAIEAIRTIAEDLGEPMANVALAWVLAKPGITSVIVGARNPDQVARNVQSVSLVLSQETLARLDQATSALKEKLGPNTDYWQAGENSRMR